MKFVIGTVATLAGVLFVVSMASANPALLPKHEGYPMKNDGSPVNGQPTANDPGQKDARGESTCCRHPVPTPATGFVELVISRRELVGRAPPAMLLTPPKKRKAGGQCPPYAIESFVGAHHPCAVFHHGGNRRAGTARHAFNDTEEKQAGGARPTPLRVAHATRRGRSAYWLSSRSTITPVAIATSR